MFRTRRTILVLGDIISLGLAFFAMAALRFDFHTQASFVTLQAKFFGIIFLLWLIVFFIFELYSIDRINPNPKNIGFIFLALFINVLLTMALFYFFPQGGIAPKTNLIILSLIAFVFLISWRRLFYQLFTKTFPITIGIVGTSARARELALELDSNPHVGIVSATWEALPENHDAPIDILIVEHASPHALVATSRTLGTQAISLTQAYEMLLGKIPLDLMSDERAMHIITRQETAVRFFYRIIEIILACVALIISSPLLILAMLAIALEDGFPVFISQTRVGKNGKLISIYKLRSMRALAPDGSAELDGAQWAAQSDPRITRVGKILRKLHLDEIPQMWNIIRGDLALIGPRAERPEIVAALEKEIPYYYLRHAHTPGFTGWAQIKFRYARTILDSKEKFEYDLYYLCNKNSLLDFGIILKTIQIIFTHA
jgi:lipopolysaccharide/colanic/teichoic acid biosynthesis glycosyltransferase